MARHTETCVIFLLCVCVVAGQIATVSNSPQITSFDMAGKVTANTAVLQLPWCYFNSSLPQCNSQCNIYLVPAVDTGVNNFSAAETSLSILSLSPYPLAFVGSNPNNYYVTQVGPLSNYPCQVPSGITYFRSGAGGYCTTANCNGALPTGSTVRFKYLLFNSTQVIMDTPWSSPITLKSLSDPATIDDSVKQRSAAMIVVTTILSILLALLLLALIGLLIYACRYAPKKEPLPSLGSLRIKHYETHNVKQPQLYVNQAYVDDTKKYVSSEVVTDAKLAQEINDSLKLKRYQNYVPPYSEGKNT